MKQQHIHKLERVDIGVANPYIVWRCTLPGCTSYIRKAFIKGTQCICWRCGKEMVIATIRPQKKPVCCTKGSKMKMKESIDDVDAVFQEIL
jgi:hypothetical protein